MLLSIDGVPFLRPLNPKSPKIVQAVPIVRTIWKPNGYFAVTVLGHAGSWRECLFTTPLTMYTLWGVGASVVLLVEG